MTRNESAKLDAMQAQLQEFIGNTMEWRGRIDQIHRTTAQEVSKLAGAVRGQSTKIDTLAATVKDMQPEIATIRTTLTAVTVSRKLARWLAGALVGMAAVWTWVENHVGILAWFRSR